MAPENPVIQMSDHIKTHNLPFQSPSEPGWGFKNVIEEDHQLFQDTVPLHDAVALDSSFDETQCQLDCEMEVITDSDCIENVRINLEKEVALDSEDELDCSAEKFGGDNRIPDSKADRNVKRNKIGFFKRFPCKSSLHHQGPLSDQQCGTDARKTPPKIKCGQVSARSNDIGANEPEMSSQEKALDFIDTYLSQHEVGFSPKPKHRDVREKEPPASGLKGCQSLAKQISIRNPDGKEGTFEWGDDNHHEEIGFFVLDGSLQRPVVRNQSKESGVQADQCSFSDSRNISGSRRQLKEKEQMCPFDKSQILVGQDLEVCTMETDAQEMFDVGISTQMAAEAMEALSNGLVIDKTIDQHSQNLFIIPPTLVTKSRAHEGDFSNPRTIAKLSILRKGSSRNRTSLKNPGHQELDNEPEKTTERKLSKFMTGKLKRRDNSAQNECSTKKNLKPVKKRKNSEHESKYNNEECEDHQSSSLPFANNSLGKQCIEKESFDHQTGNWMKEQKLEGTKDESHNQEGRTNNITKSSIITYQRKRTSLSTKPSTALNAGMFSKQLKERQIFSHQAEHPMAGGEMSRLNDGANNPQERVKDIGKVFRITYQRKKRQLKAKFFKVSTAEGKNSTLCTLTHQIQDNREVSPLTNSLCFNTWSSTKGKRTLRKRRRHSDAAKNQFNSFVAFDEKENYRKPYNKILPKSSMLKELARLAIPNQEPDFKWKDSRKRRDMAKVKVLLSQHLDDDIIKQQKRILARYDISIASCSSDATHFVADQFVRTRNMLGIIALGKPVVTHSWLESCAQTSCLINEENYILRDAKKEKEIGFTMPVSLAHARQHPLLEGRKVFITPNIKPDKDIISSLIKAVGGQAIEKGQISISKIPDDLLILSSEEDEDVCVPFLRKGAAVYSSELLLSGIIMQRLEYERHQLFTKYGQRNRLDVKR